MGSSPVPCQQGSGQCGVPLRCRRRVPSVLEGFPGAAMQAPSRRARPPTTVGIQPPVSCCRQPWRRAAWLLRSKGPLPAAAASRGPQLQAPDQRESCSIFPSHRRGGAGAGRGLQDAGHEGTAASGEAQGQAPPVPRAVAPSVPAHGGRPRRARQAQGAGPNAELPVWRLAGRAGPAPRAPGSPARDEGPAGRAEAGGACGSPVGLWAAHPQPFLARRQEEKNK